MVWIMIAGIVLVLSALKIGFYLVYESARRDAHRDLYNALAKFDFRNNGNEIKE